MFRTDLAGHGDLMFPKRNGRKTNRVIAGFVAFLVNTLSGTVSRAPSFSVPRPLLGEGADARSEDKHSKKHIGARCRPGSEAGCCQYAFGYPLSSQGKPLAARTWTARKNGRIPKSEFERQRANSDLYASSSKPSRPQPRYPKIARDPPTQKSRAQTEVS